MIQLLLIAQLFLPAGPGAWRRLGPMEGERAEFLVDFVVDGSGTPWTMARNLLYRWDGEEWQALEGFSSGQYLTGLWGGPKRGAWLTQRDARPHLGKLYRLEGREPVFAADFYYDVSHEYPGIYVSRSGEVFNWSDRFIARLTPRGWKSFETNVAKTRDHLNILDWGPEGPIFFLHRYQGRGVIWDAKGFRVATGLDDLPRSRQGTTPGLRGAPLGPDRALLFAYGGHDLWILDLEPEARLRNATDLVKVEAGLIFYDAWSAPDGSAWMLVHRPRAPGYHFLHVAVDGTVAAVEQPFAKHWDNTRCSFQPDSMLQSREGEHWFGLARGGLRRLVGGDATIFDWKVGVDATRIDWIFETKEGEIFAAGHPHEVYRWDPKGRPDTRATSEWMEIADRSGSAPLCAPDRTIWAFRAERPGMLSRWDGERWNDQRVPFDATKVYTRIADDQGRLIVDLGHDLGTYLVGPKEIVHYARFPDALLATVKTGARKFTSHDLVGPVIDAQGRIWFGRSERLYLYADGAWSTLSGVKTAAISGEASFLTTRRALVRYRGGRLEAAVPASPSSRVRPGDRVWILGEYYDWALPYRADFPADLRADFLPVHFPASGVVRPLTWEEADRGPAGLGAPDDGRDKRFSAAAWTDPEGLHWIRREHGTLWRCIGGEPVALGGAGTPLRTLPAQRIGTDPRGAVWIDVGNIEGSWRTFLSRGRSPELKLSKPTVQHGRWLCGRVHTDAEAVAILVRIDGGPWHRLGGGSALRLPALQPGRRTLGLELRAMGGMGQLGPTVSASYEVDVRLPDTEWKTAPPPREKIAKLLWQPRVRGLWTGEEHVRGFEVSRGGGPWHATHQNGHVAVGAWPKGTATVRIRAIEDGTFADPDPLSIKVAVELDLAAEIDEMLARVMDGQDDIVELAATALAPAKHSALPRLRSRREQIETGLRRARQEGRPTSVAELQDIWQRLHDLERKLQPGQ